MKKLNYIKLSLVVIFAAISISVLSFKTEKKSKTLHEHQFKKDTPFELGDFEEGGVDYAVYGTNSPHVITGVYFMSDPPLIAVDSFYTTGRFGGWIGSSGARTLTDSLYVKPHATDPVFSKTGTLAFF